MLTSWTKILAVLSLGSITFGACAMDGANSGDDTTGAVTNESSGTIEAPQRVSPIVPAAALITNIIVNEWTGGNLGVIHVKDGSYTHGTYDELLSPNQNTSQAPLNWTTAAGFFIGPGSCAHLMRSDNFGPWTTQGDVGSGQHFIGANTSYQVFPFKC